MTDELADLRARLERSRRPGVLEWIGCAARRRAPLLELDEARLEPGTGLVGEHHARRGGKRQVTLVQAEHFAVLSAMLGRPVAPEDLRRNLVVSGLNLLSLKGRRFRVGSARLEYSGPSSPCSRMEETLGTGGYQALRGHGGICAIVLEGGDIRRGDRVVVELEEGRDS